jgi:hypothetical protein
VASAPVRWVHGLANKRVLGLECEEAKVLGVSAGNERARGPELALGAGHGGWHGQGTCEVGRTTFKQGCGLPVTTEML